LPRFRLISQEEEPEKQFRCLQYPFRKMNISESLYQKLRENGLDFFTSVPCKFLDELISLVSKDDAIVYTPVSREEEGVGISAGAFMGGRRPALLMQNTGLGNSINAICSLLNYYQIPVVFVISHRGTENEIIDAQKPMGEATKSLLEITSIPYLEVRERADMERIDELISSGLEKNQSVALLLPQVLWRENGDGQ